MAALTELAKIDAEKAELVQLRYFGGLTIEGIREATCLDESLAGKPLMSPGAALFLVERR